MTLNMKNLIYIIAIFFAGAVTSCSKDYLDAPTKSSLDESVIFANVDLAKSAVDGIKIDFGETNSYRGRFLPWYGMNTDIEWYNNSDKYPDGKADLCVYAATPTNSQMNDTKNAWAKMYEGIERANMCIKGIRAYGNPQPGNDMGQLLGEALTLRAVYYSDLVKAWGDVPARFEPITTATLYLPRVSRDSILKHLIADLGEAETLVAWPNATSATSDVEHINKAFVKGFRARLCMEAAGYYEHADGSVGRSSDPDLSVDKMYPIALQECQDVINSGTCQLEPSFETVFKKNCQDNINAGGESLWEIPFADGRGRMLFTFAVPHKSVDQFTSQARGGQAGPLPYMYYDYNSQDTRRDVSCVPYYWGVANKEGIAQQEPSGIDTWYFGKYRYEWMNRIVTSTNDDGVNKIYMRYAEVVLMAAEAANELDGPSAAAPYLKMIRERAFPESDWSTEVDDYINNLTTKETMFNAIVKENKLEFCGEMLRKEQLIRWNLLKTELDSAKIKMNELANRTGEYADVPSKLYYGYESDGVTLKMYGLNRGETADKSSDYAYSTTWADPTQLTDTKINSIYAQDPDQYQFWPIWQVFIDASNGQLKNEYAY
ncbi:starch-binding protein [Prolixibacter sp. NT017]|nr:starch-binding protein [Prolixibacter sp. NT017]